MASSPSKESNGAHAPVVEEPKNDLQKEPEQVKLFGYDISGMTSRNQFILLSSGALVSALLFAALQEKVFLIEGFHYSGFMTVLTTATFMIMAALERLTLGETKRKGSLRDYALLSIFTFLGMYFTNASLKFLTYPTRVVFKSSKVVPVMLASVVIVGRKYSIGEYMAAGLLVFGISMFTLADKGLPSFNIIGIVLITLGVVADAVTCNFEERRFFRNLSCSQAEVVLFSSLFGLVLSVGTIVGTGELVPALDHAFEHPEVFFYTLFFSSCGYSSVVFVLLLIKVFGSTNAEIVKSCRKVMSIVLSFVLYAKPVVWQHVVGGSLFVLSIVITVQLKASRKKKPAAYAAVPQQDAASANGSASAAAGV